MDDGMDCYVCDARMPASMFGRDNQAVCLACRSSEAYTALNAYLHLTKWCSGCNSREPLTEFKMEKGSIAWQCKRCQRARNLSYKKQGEDAWTYRKLWFRTLKGLLRCSHCHEDRKELVLFHLDPTSKQFTIGEGMYSHTVEELKEEMRKCEPLCRECSAHLASSRLYLSGNARKKPTVDWDRYFALAEEKTAHKKPRPAVVQPLLDR